MGGLLEKIVRSEISICPESGVSRPATDLNRVVFPDPLAPTMTKNSPAFTSIFNLFRATTLPSSTKNSLWSSLIEITLCLPLWSIPLLAIMFLSTLVLLGRLRQKIYEQKLNIKAPSMLLNKNRLFFVNERLKSLLLSPFKFTLQAEP